MPRKKKDFSARCSLPTAHSAPTTAHAFPGRPTWAEIDLDALIRNFRTLESLLDPHLSDCGLEISGSGSSDKSSDSIGDSSFVIRHSSLRRPRLIPVLKADAYGHGATHVARTLAEAGATAFAVALVEEGIALREAGIHVEILVLEGAWPGQEAELVRHGLTATVYSADGIRRLDLAAKNARTPAPVHIKIDTGMSRLGVAWDQMEEFLRDLHGARGLQVTGVFSHLASAEEEDSSYTLEQIRRFCCALDSMTRAGIEPGEIHIANSAGILYFPQLRSCSARPGIALYGYPPSAVRCAVEFKPVLTVKTRVGHIHRIRAGESAGYNRRFVAARETRAATLPAGYADGYDRRLAGLGRVIIRDRWAPVLGAVSMDMIVVEITDLPDVKEGDEAILLGSATNCRMDAAVWADLLDTIPYEVLCGFSPRVPRVYKGK